jgi:ABC-type glycerol-3-phosphate transport system substrate-binding protein
VVGEGFNPEEDAALREIIAAFERETSKRVDLEEPPQSNIEAKALAAVRDGQPAVRDEYELPI